MILKRYQQYTAMSEPDITSNQRTNKTSDVPETWPNSSGQKKNIHVYRYPTNLTLFSKFQSTKIFWDQSHL